MKEQKNITKKGKINHKQQKVNRNEKNKETKVWKVRKYKEEDSQSTDKWEKKSPDEILSSKRAKSKKSRNKEIKVGKMQDKKNNYSYLFIFSFLK